MTRTRSRGIEYVLLACVVAAISWGALAFGSVYPWAYRPLIVLCAIVGVTALIVERRSGPSIRALALALSAIAVAAALQLVPLSQQAFVRISPAGDAFLKSYDLSYQLAAAGAADPSFPGKGASGTHPISIAPDKTALGLTMFAAFAVFLLGLVRLVSAIGAAAIARPLIWFGMLLAIVGIAQAALLSDHLGVVREVYGFWKPQFGGTPFGPFVNRNHFAGWIVMGLPLAVAAAFAAWERGKADDPAGGLRTRLIWLSSPAAAGLLLMSLAAGVMGLSLLMTQSRSGAATFGAAAVMFAFVAVRRQPTRRAGLLAGAAVGVAFLGIAAWAGLGTIVERAPSVAEDVADSGGRLSAWADTLRIIRDFPLTGAGLNSYGKAMMTYQSRDLGRHFQEAHNEYLQIAAEGGVLIGLPVLVTLALVARDIRRRFREAPTEGTTYWLRVGAVVGLVSIGLQSLVDFSLQMPGNTALFAVLAAIALHQSPSFRHASPARERSGRRREASSGDRAPSPLAARAPARETLR